MIDYAWLIPLFPLIGVLINATLGRWLKRPLAAIIACLAVGASFAMAILVLIEMLGLHERKVGTWDAAIRRKAVAAGAVGGLRLWVGMALCEAMTMPNAAAMRPTFTDRISPPK